MSNSTTYCEFNYDIRGRDNYMIFFGRYANKKRVYFRINQFSWSRLLDWPSDANTALPIYTLVSSFYIIHIYCEPSSAHKKVGPFPLEQS